MNSDIKTDQKHEPANGGTRHFAVPAAGVKGRLDAWLSKQCSDISRSRLQRLIKEGRVTLRGGVVKANAKLKPGQIYSVVFPPGVSVVPEPEDVPLNVLYEDSDCIVINKPAGLVVHPAPGHPDGTLVNALLWRCRNLAATGEVERPGIVHRLDKDTSGVMVAVKNDLAMAGFVRLFQTGGMRKEYLAVVHGELEPESGLIANLIGRDPNNRKKMAVVSVNGKEARTHYRVERGLSEGLSLVRCRIETGRTHQIRVHMKSLSAPVIGDPLYGRPALDKKLSVRPTRQILHARRLSFRHPLKGAHLSIEAPFPKDFEVYRQLI